MSQSLSPARNSFVPTTGRVQRAGLVVGLIVAVLLHAAIIVATLFGWQHQLEIADESPPVVPVDVITIGAKTNIASTIERHQQPQPKDEVTPPPQNTPATTPPPPQAEAAPEPTPVPPLPKPEPTPKPVTKPATPQPQAPAQPDQKKPKTDDFSSLLNKLTAPSATPRNAHVADRTVRGVGAMNGATMDLVDALRSQIAQCWSPPIGAPKSEELVVDFDLLLNADGSVAQPPQLTEDSAARAARDPYTRAAVEAARRAIFTCAPYKLPADRYAQWREINPFHFDPRQMMGQ
jgi:outer membrane biosynthesis protein TonB